MCTPIAFNCVVGLFYYTLGNLRPELRSTLRSIQLIACATYPNITKYGFPPILHPFIQDVNRLSENGFTLSVHGMEATIRGAVLVALADTLAAHQLGGFKAGVGLALHKCRDCMATGQDIQNKFTEDAFVLRDTVSYDHQCTLLEGPLAAHDSTAYGINYRSTLNNISFFHIAAGQLPQDIMHVLYEGVFPMEVKLLLTKFIYGDKFITLMMLNERISNFTYGRNERRNKPAKPFTKEHLVGNSKLPLSAIQMWTFATILPLLIGDKIPLENPQWECFLLLLQISKLCTAKVISPGLSAYLSALVEQHHQEFKLCYPGVSLTPKMHYMVHLPSEMLRVGPLIASWCMRMEAKNSYFKKVARVGNFQNIAYSVAKRHQRLMCAYLQNSRFFTYDDLQCGPCISSDKHICEDPHYREILRALPDLGEEAVISRPKWINMYGEGFYCGDFVTQSTGR